MVAYEVIVLAPSGSIVAMGPFEDYDEAISVCNAEKRLNPTAQVWVERIED